MQSESTTPHSGVVSPTPYEEAKEQKAKMVRKMLYYGYQMGYDVPRSPAQQRMDKARVNYVNVEAWCQSKYCSINKTLKGYTVEQLAKVLSQFEAVYKSFIQQYNKAG